MNAKQKKTLVRIIVTAVIFAVLSVLKYTGKADEIMPSVAVVLMFLVPYAVIGFDVIIKAAKNISHGQVFDENFLMLTATVGAFIIGEYPEAVAVMLFYQVGELFQSYAVGRSRKSIADMMNICPEYANVEIDGELQKLDPEDVEIGSSIIIKPGERVPLDGVVVEGDSMLDTAALTGESLPRRVGEGDSIYSGCINCEGSLRVKVTKTYEDSTVSKILELVENASSKKANTENFITRFAKYYTPIVTVSALLLVLIPLLFFGGVWSEWVGRACVFLVISCPCALVISVPMGFFGGIGAASRIGVLVKGSNYFEVLADVSVMVFDKTGTLTKGGFTLCELVVHGIEPDELLELASYAENYSNHPIANSIKQAYGKQLLLSRIGDTEEIAGLGIHTYIDGDEVLSGNAKLMERFGVECIEYDGVGSVVYVARNRIFCGAVVVSDKLKDGVQDAILQIKDCKVKKCVMLSGDSEKVASGVSEKLGLDAYRAELLPADKMREVEKLLGELEKKEKLAFVGDGINDAPVLTRADVGIAMGSMGADAAIEAADIVIMDDNISKIPQTLKIARRTLAIVKQNIVFALGVKAVVLALGSLGFSNMWEAVFADVGVSVIAILNSMRALKVNKLK